MELSILLIQQICQLFIMIFFGFLLVRGRVLTAENSKVLSILLLYVACPCAIINSFMIDFTSDKLIGLGISFLGAILVHIIFIPLANLLGKIFGFTPIEKATLIYSNSGNLIIPLVGAILGNEWVIYSSGYMVIQTILLWTHAKSLVCNEPSFDVKKILLNINIIAIIIGICLFMFQLQLPSLLVDTFSKVGSMMGPLAMIVIGMLIGEMDLRSIFVEKRTYLISLFRLVVFPLIMILIFKFTGMSRLTVDADKILLITILAASAPPAATITQFAQLYNKHPKDSSRPTDCNCTGNTCDISSTNSCSKCSTYSLKWCQSTIRCVLFAEHASDCCFNCIRKFAYLEKTCAKAQIKANAENAYHSRNTPDEIVHGRIDGLNKLKHKKSSFLLVQNFTKDTITRYNLWFKRYFKSSIC